jgi:membrane fusion protein
VAGLFRNEVLQERRTQFLGTIRIGRNPSFTLVSMVALLLAAGLVSYAAWGEITRKARLAGVLIPVQGTINLSSPQAGTLADVRVKEGDAVEANQILMVVGTYRATSQGEAATLIAQSMEQRRATLQTERSLADVQHRQRQQATADRLRSLEAEARHAEGEMVSVQRRLDLAKKSVERYAELAKSGFVSEIQVQQKQEELLDLTTRQTTAERSLLGIRRDAQDLRAEQAANASALQAQLAQIDRSLASLRQEGTENQARREVVVTAPQAGTVTALLAHTGQGVAPGQTLATLIPRAPDGRPSPLAAHLFAPSRTAGFVQAGQVVWVRYAAYPYQKFGMAKGAIESVSRTPLSPQDLPVGQGVALMNAAQSVEPMYRVTVALESQAIRTYGEVQPLKAGMTLEADVVQERRRVWEWLLEPVLAASGLSKSLASPSR